MKPSVQELVKKYKKLYLQVRAGRPPKACGEIKKEAQKDLTDLKQLLAMCPTK